MEFRPLLGRIFQLKRHKDDKAPGFDMLVLPLHAICSTSYIHAYSVLAVRGLCSMGMNAKLKLYILDAFGCLLTVVFDVLHEVPLR